MKEGHALRDSNLDLRVVRTKTAIRNALVELIEEKGFDAITVKDITTKANINRGTFYAHYQDKFDLMTKCQEDIMYEFSNIAKEIPRSDCGSRIESFSNNAVSTYHFYS